MAGLMGLLGAFDIDKNKDLAAQSASHFANGTEPNKEVFGASVIAVHTHAFAPPTDSEQTGGGIELEVFEKFCAPLAFGIASVFTFILFQISF